MRNKYFLGILLFAFALRLAFAFAIPSWQSPDEYPHYWVAKEIAGTKNLPSKANSSDFPSYESFQPPLYYALLSVPVFLQEEPIEFSEEITRPPFDLILLRLISVLFGTLSVLMAYLFFLNIPSLKKGDALYAAAFIALLPTYAGMNASINNDSLSVLLSFICLYFANKENFSIKDAFLSGMFGGLALITKMNSLPVFFIGLYIIGRRYYPEFRKNNATFTGYVIPWIFFAAILILRDLIFYKDLFVIAPGKERFFGFSITYFLWAIKNLAGSFWLAFGRYYKVVPGPVAYAVTFAPIMLLAAWGWIKRKKEDKHLLLEISGAVFIMTAASLYYTLTYKEGTMTSWGKYLYPVLPYFALFFILGWKKILNSNILPNICLCVLLFWNIWAIINVSAIK